MAASASVDVSQIRRLSVDLRQVPVEAVGTARRVVQAFSAKTKADAQVLCPVDTGFLRGSITYETFFDRTGAVGIIGPTANYGLFVELGTSRMSGQPYLGPAFDRNEPGFEAALRDVGVLR